MRLLERRDDFDALVTCWERARAGHGGMVIVGGEAGAGKSSLVEQFVASCGDQPVLWGACDPLSTPRPLGPLHDLAPEIGDLTRAPDGAPRQAHEIYAAFFDRLRTTGAVFVVDDLHWADQGTIDLLRYLLRRVGATGSLVVGTVRNDEIGTDHPLRTLLGDVARSADATSTTLRPLTVEAVRELVGDRPLDPGWLHATTGGNPFFVVEMLDHRRDDLPATVRDAVLARTSGLDGSAWDVLHLLACAPEAIPDQLLIPLGVGLPQLRALDDVGLIRRGGRGVTFRHDLCRTAIEGTIPPGGGAALHRRMLEALEASPSPDPAVLVHHAVGARDPARIRRHAEAAGRAAARSGAHTQAAEFYAIALDHGALAGPAEQAELLELLADECYLIDRLPQAISASERALGLRHQLGDPVGVSLNHRQLAGYHWYNGDRTRAEQHAHEAVAALGKADEPVGGPPLGYAVAKQAYFALQQNDLVAARALAAEAARVGGDVDPKVPLLIAIIEGICDVVDTEGPSRGHLLDLIAGSEHELDEIYSTGYSNLTYLDVEQRRLADASDLLAKSIPMTVERDLPICRAWQIGSRGRLKLSAGDWDDALADSDEVLLEPSAPLARTWPLIVRGLVTLRRGGDASEDLEDAWALAGRLAEPMRLMPVASALIEQAWMGGRDEPRLDAFEALLTSAPEPGLEWARGELASRLRRVGRPVTAEGIAEPYRLELAGEHEAAAAAWAEIGVPFEEALCLLDSGRPELRRKGLDLLDRLGATTTADWFRQDLRSRGVTDVPSRRRKATLANAAGLTGRQTEVLALLHEGLTNAELADRLYISAKTADHHVSAILSKLNVNSRRDAVRAAKALHLID